MRPMRKSAAASDLLLLGADRMKSVILGRTYVAGTERLWTSIA